VAVNEWAIGEGRADGLRIREYRDASGDLYHQRATGCQERAELGAKSQASTFGYGGGKIVQELDGCENETLKNEIDCARGKKSLDVDAYAGCSVDESVIVTVKDRGCGLVRSVVQKAAEAKVEVGEKYHDLNHVWAHGLEIHGLKGLLPVPLERL
jgi:hypothetical protein